MKPKIKTLDSMEDVMDFVDRRNRTTFWIVRMIAILVVVGVVSVWITAIWLIMLVSFLDAFGLVDQDLLKWLYTR